MIEKFAPLRSKHNEENQENSTYNQERINIDMLSEYQSKEKYQELINSKAKEITDSFNNIFNTIKMLENTSDYYKTESELHEEIQALNEENNKHVKTLSDTIEFIG